MIGVRLSSWASQPAKVTVPSVGERVPWVDTAKGICIVLVVMMHSTLGVGEAMGGDGFLHWVVAFARPFRMPDFFLVSGLFLSRVIDRDWRIYADKRVVHFLYFYVLWLVIQSAFKFGQVSAGTLTGFLQHLGQALIEPYSTLWFIYLLAVFSIVTKLLRGVPPLVLLGGAALLQILSLHTPSFLLDEFCGRYGYFLIGYLCAPFLFKLADHARLYWRSALVGLGAWAIVNGFFALTPSDVEGYPMLAQLPGLSLILGIVGAMAIVMIAAIIADTPAALPFMICGGRSIVIYLAFFLPMAVTRTVLIKTGIITDIGLVSLLVTIAAVIVPLLFERLIRGTALNFLFKRPALFHLKPLATPRLHPVE